MWKILSPLLLLVILFAGTNADPLTFQVDIVGSSDQTRAFPHFWKRCVGSGHLLLGTRQDWRTHLRLARDELGMQGIRGHGLFDDDMSVVPGGKPYEFYTVDLVLDYLVELGMKPVVELSFMPSHFVSCGPNQNVTCSYAFDDHGSYKGLIMPPDNFDDWYDLVQSLGSHLVGRYGIEEVSSWAFEVWNEMWGISYPHPYLALYNASALALKSIDTRLRVGGPATMQTQYVSDFIDATKKANLPVDFISTHFYPTDPECRTNDTIHARDCFVSMTQHAADVAAASGIPFFLTEYNNGLGPTSRDDSSAAAFVFRMIDQLEGFDIFSWWTFSDVFEEGWMRSEPFHNGFGMMTMRGVRKPVWRAFEALESAGTLRYGVRSSSSNSTRVSVLATNEESSGMKLPSAFDLQLFVASWDRPSPTQEYACDRTLGQCVVASSGPYTDPSLCEANCDKTEPAKRALESNSGDNDVVTIEITHAAHATVPAFATMHRIAPGFADPKRRWIELGSPTYPTAVELEALHNASSVVPEKVKIVRESDTKSSITVTISLYTAAKIFFS